MSKEQKKGQVHKRTLQNLRSNVPDPSLDKNIVRDFQQYLKGPGRPSRYKKSYCQKIIALLSQGKDLNTAAIEMGAGVFYSIRNWVKRHPEFLRAVKTGIKMSRRWWIENGRLNIYNRDFNHILWMMNMSNRFKWTTSSVDKKIDKKINYNKVVRIEHSTERCAKILSILASAGAISQGVETVNDSKADKVYTN